MAVVQFPVITSGASTASGAGLVAVGIVFNNTAAGGVVHGLRFDAPAAQASGVSIAIYKNGAGTIAAQKSGLSLTSGENFLTFDTPLTIEEDTTYLAFIFQPTLNYHYGAAHPDDTAFGTWESGPYNAAGGSPAGAYIEDDDIVTAPVSIVGDARINPTANYYGLRIWWNDGPADTLTVTTNTPQTVDAGVTVSMVATPHDANGTVTYSWARTSGPSSPTITNATSATASITPTVAGTYVYTVTATDDVGEDDATLTITVSAVDPDPDPPATTGDAVWFKSDGEWFGPFGGASQADPDWVFRPETYGALGDGTTDDTAAFNACVTAAVAAAPANNYLAVIELSAKVYALSTPAVPGREHGNAMISLPYIDALTSKKVHLAFRGPADNTGFIHWAQGSTSLGGATIRSLWNPTSLLSLDENDVNFGVPSVIGGIKNFDSVPPTAYATVSNMHVSVDGVQIVVPRNAYLGGFDFSGLAQATVKSACVLNDGWYEGTPNIRTLPTHDLAYGLMMPRSGSNARNSIGDFLAEGMSVGVFSGEHLSAAYIGAVYCRTGLVLGSNGNDSTWNSVNGAWPATSRPSSHGAQIGRLLVEGCITWLDGTDFNAQVNIAQIDGEGVGSFVKHINDPSNDMVGEVHINDPFQYLPVVTGAARLRIISDGVARGAQTAPSVPATTVALLNPFWRDADVYVAGGTVTAIAVDGLTLGVTSGMVRVPTGKSITLTYSSAPTWKWLLP